MDLFSHISILLLIFPGSFCLISNLEQSNSVNQTHTRQHKSNTNQLDVDLIPDDAQGSPNFFTSGLGSYESPSDYGAFFDHFPDLPYFPEFGEIFRLSRTTTPQPPFRFPSYVRDPFPDTSGQSDSVGGRRPSRRPPRPASSGTRTKVSKHNQNEPKEKSRSLKTKPPIKSRNFPKIFRFTSDRVNLADFDMKKKVNENYLTLTKGDELDSDKVKRNEFLILHGGVFEIEPSGGRSGLIAASTNRNPEVTSVEAPDSFKASERNRRAAQRKPFFYKT